MAQDALDAELALMLSVAEPETWKPTRTVSGAPTPRISDLTIEAELEGELSPEERREAYRFELDQTLVRVRIAQPDGRFAPGRLFDITTWGGLYVETKYVLPFRSDVDVVFQLDTGHEVEFTGRVVRVREGDGMALRLNADLSSRGFLAAFVDEILRPDSVRAPVLMVRPQQSEAPPDEVEVQLEAAWQSASADIGDEVEQQKFIELCLTHRRIDFGLDAYRRVKQAQPDDERPDRYLTQLGTILGFYAFSRQDDMETPTGSSLIGPILVVSVAVLGLFLLWMLAA